MALLAARSPKLGRALAKDAGHVCLVIDGTLIPVGQVATDRPFYSGKHRKHGMNLQVIASPAGDIVWVSGPLPGTVHDLTVARIWGIAREPGDLRAWSCWATRAKLARTLSAPCTGAEQACPQ